ncbi:MAG: tetratricopeptide repeat protein [Pseudomonadota bacterium]
MREADTRGERLRNGVVLGIVLVALGLALAPKLKEWSGSAKATPARLDLAAEPMPFPRPVSEPQDHLPAAPPLPETVAFELDLQRAFFAGDFARFDAAMHAAREDFFSGRSEFNRAVSVVERIGENQLAGIDRCAEWLQAMPESYVAHWTCGAIWTDGAWAARGRGFAHEVAAARFILMEERLERATVLLARALELSPQPLEALIEQARNHFAAGRTREAEDLLQRAERIRPAYWDIHWTRLNYAQPQWYGSAEAIQAALARARQAGVQESVLLDMEDSYVARPWKNSTPGAEHAYWEAAIAKHPTRARLTGLLNDFIRLENWHEALPVANRLIEDYPDDSKAYYQRARTQQAMGRIEAAREDYRMAAAMGHELALQELIMAHIGGGLGLPKSFPDVLPLCRYGAALGSGVGANCLGAIHFEGGQHGVPLPKDLPQSLAWHLLGARAGHFNSQYDLGWLLYTGRGAGVDAKTGERHGIFWLRRAAEQNQTFAKRKLEELGISPSESRQSGILGGLNIGAFLEPWFGALEHLRDMLN